MAHDAERGCPQDEPDSLLGDHGLYPPGLGRFRWVCGASPGLPAGSFDGKPARPGGDQPEPPSGTTRSLAPVDPPSGTTRSRAPVDPPSGGACSPAQADDPAGLTRSGDVPEGVVRSTGPDEVDRGGVGTGPERVGDRSRLVPRPRSGEPGGVDDIDVVEDQESIGCAAGSAGGSDEARDGSPGMPDDEDGRRTPGCQTDRPGWAGAHRHGAVRPSRRAMRRDRPPRRWC